MMVNAFLGTVLWTTYANVLHVVEPHLGCHPILAAALAGSFAGGAQALVAAPAENVRLVIEGGSGASSGFHAWKEVVKGTRRSSVSRQNDMEYIRQLRNWMKEVGEMAGRGWHGWRWGFGKDIFGESPKQGNACRHMTLTRLRRFLLRIRGNTSCWPGGQGYISRQQEATCYSR